MSSAKGMLIDFLNFIFALLLVGLCILYFIAGDNFETFKNILRSLAPLAALGVLFMIRLKFWREKGKKFEREGGGESEIVITFVDKLKMDLFVFSFPALVCLLAIILKGTIEGADLLSAAAVLLLAYCFTRWILKKAR